MTAPRRLLAAAFVVLLVLAAFLGFRDDPNDTDIVARAPITAHVQPLEALPAPIGEFPEEELRSSFIEVCSTDTPGSANKELTQEEIQEQIDAFKELRQGLSERLSVSSSAEHLQLAALLEDDPSLRVDLLERAISLSPSDPFLIWAAVQTCSDSAFSPECPLPDWEQHLIAVDGQNSESWVRVAANRYVAGELDAALEAMRHASTAAESRVYWAEMIEMIERGFAAGSDYAFPERAAMAFGIAASKIPRYGDYVTMCKEQSAQSVEWAHACLAYGELVENQGKTEIGVSISRSIQRLSLEALGEFEKAAEVEQRLQARRQDKLNSIKDYNPTIERLIFSNSTLFSAYLAAIKSEGEVAAQRRIIAEVERLLEQRPQLACE